MPQKKLDPVSERSLEFRQNFGQTSGYEQPRNPEKHFEQIKTIEGMLDNPSPRAIPKPDEVIGMFTPQIIVDYFLEKPHSLTKIYPDGNTFFHVAAVHEPSLVFGIIENLIKNGSPLPTNIFDIKNSVDRSSLELLRINSTDVFDAVSDLLETQRSINTSAVETTLITQAPHQASFNENDSNQANLSVKKIESFFQSGDNDGLASHSSQALANFISKNPHAANKHGNTPFHLLASTDPKKLVKVIELLEVITNNTLSAELLNQKNKGNSTVLDLLPKSAEDVKQFLIERDAVYNLNNKIENFVLNSLSCTKDIGDTTVEKIQVITTQDGRKLIHNGTETVRTPQATIYDGRIYSFTKISSNQTGLQGSKAESKLTSVEQGAFDQVSLNEKNTADMGGVGKKVTATENPAPILPASNTDLTNTILPQKADKVAEHKISVLGVDFNNFSDLLKNKSDEELGLQIAKGNINLSERDEYGNTLLTSAALHDRLDLVHQIVISNQMSAEALENRNNAGKNALELVFSNKGTHSIVIPKISTVEPEKLLFSPVEGKKITEQNISLLGIDFNEVPDNLLTGSTISKELENISTSDDNPVTKPTSGYRKEFMNQANFESSSTSSQQFEDVSSDPFEGAPKPGDLKFYDAEYGYGHGYNCDLERTTPLPTDYYAYVGEIGETNNLLNTSDDSDLLGIGEHCSLHC